MFTKERTPIAAASDKFQALLRDLNEKEREALVAMLLEAATRARLASELQAPMTLGDPLPDIATRSAPPRPMIQTAGLGPLAVGIVLPMAAKFVGGVAGHFAGGGDWESVPWREIYNSSV